MTKTKSMTPNNILIIIDVQQKYISRYSSELVPKLNKLIQAAVEADTPVIYVLNAGTSPDSEISPLANGLIVVPGAKIVKRKPSAFTSEEFIDALEACHGRTLVIAGIDGSCCVAHTAIDGVRKGYHVKVILSCVESVNEGHYQKALEEMKSEGVELCSEG